MKPNSTDVWVMCGGPSADLKLSVLGDIIAVNKDAFRYYDKATYTITMDNRFTLWELFSKNRIMPSQSTNIFIANMEPEYMRHTVSFSDSRCGTSYNLSPYDMIIKSYRSDGFGLTFKDFRTGHNSGYCGLQLALILGYTRIHLVGLDLTIGETSTHHHEGYSKSKDNFEERLKEFEGAFRAAIKSDLKLFRSKIINHSPVSPLRDLLGYEPLEA